MTIERKFHVLIAAAFVIGTIGGNIDSWLHVGVREKAWVESVLSLEFPSHSFFDALPGWLFLSLTGSYMILFTFSIYGLANFRNWGRIGALALTVVGLALQLDVGPRVVTAPSIMFTAMMLILWGGILMMSFTEPLATKFTLAKSKPG